MFLRFHALLVLCGLAACGRDVSLPDVPIEGASPEVEDLLRDVLVRFDEQVGHDRLRIARVVVREMDDGHEGRWQPLNSTVVLSSRLSESLPSVLRHELCHALDAAEGPFFAEREALYGRLAQGVMDTDLLKEGACKAGSRCVKEEVFAGFCLIDAVLTRAVARDRCLGDPQDAIEVAAHLADRVWTGDLPPPAHFGPTVEYPVDTDVLSVYSGGTQKPTTAFIAWDDGLSGDPEAFVDVRTGREDPDEPDEGWRLEDHWEIPPLDLVGAEYVPVGAGWRDGPAVAYVEIDMLHLGILQRFLWTPDGSGEDWTGTEPGCVPSGTRPFGADGAVYATTKRFGAVGWQEISDEF